MLCVRTINKSIAVVYSESFWHGEGKAKGRSKGYQEKTEGMRQVSNPRLNSESAIVPFSFCVLENLSRSAWVRV